MSLISRRRPRSIFICTACIRTLTTATTKPTSTPSNPKIAGNLNSALEANATEVPPYPYGAARWYKQSDRGLYGGQRIRFGNNVAEGHGNEPNGVKTRRSWGVNWFNKRLFSKSLGQFVELRVSNRVLRTIDKVGGLDEYLLGEKEGRIKGLGLKGWELRWAIMQSRGMKARFEKEKAKLGMEGLENEVSGLEAQTAAEQEVEEAVEEAPAEEDEVVSGDASQAKHVKIRTAPGQHLVLTHDGWASRVKTEPDTRIRSEVYNKIFREQFKDRWQEASAELQTRMQQISETDLGDEHPLTKQEQKELLNRTKWMVRKQIKDSEGLANAVRDETARMLEYHTRLAKAETQNRRTKLMRKEKQVRKGGLEARAKATRAMKMRQTHMERRIARAERRN